MANCAVLKQEFQNLTADPDKMVVWMRQNYNTIVTRSKRDKEARWIRDAWAVWCLSSMEKAKAGINDADVEAYRNAHKMVKAGRKYD